MWCSNHRLLLVSESSVIMKLTSLSWLENAYSCPVFWQAILTRKVGQTDLVFGIRPGFILVGLCMQDYKSLCAVVAIYSTLVNIQTHTPTDST